MPPARMRRPGPSPELRRGRVPPPPTLDDEPTLQLAIAREGIGLELSGAVDLGVANLLRARAKLVGLRFPLDVSGGVERFRHRRTALELAEVSIAHAAAERWLSAMAHDLLSRGAADARIAILSRDAREARDEDRKHGDLRIELSHEEESGVRALVSFDVTVGALDGGLVAFAHRLRAIGNAAPATALAGRLFSRLATALSGHARGVRLELPDPTRLPLVAAFVTRGARVPTRDGVAVSALSSDASGWSLTFDRGKAPLAPSRTLTALLELDRLVGDGDRALVAGDAEEARALYQRALERAPRHKAILSRLGELDASADQRAEAALTWLREAQRARGATSRDQDDNDLGRTLLASSLQARIGHLGRARAGFQRAGERAIDDGETRLASRAFSAAAATCADDDPLLPSLLDRALATDPQELEARWRRARLRIHARTPEGDERALEDVQHLEAQAHGRDARRATLLRAGALWASAGRTEHAVPAYERALRLCPDDRAIVHGLGRALIAAGEARGVALLVRALQLPGDREGHDAIVLDLARALARQIGDLPSAIARLREIDGSSPRAAMAKLLEGSMRAQLGDRVGAERALLEGVDLGDRRSLPPEDVEAARGILVNTARAFRDEPEVAHRLALAAVSIAPLDAEARALVRELARRPAPAIVAPKLETEPLSPMTRHGTPITHATEDELAGAPLSISLDPDSETSAGAPDDESRAEHLLARVKANPDDDVAVFELVELLSRLGRDFELFALLSARLDEAPADRRAAMIPTQRAVLERMAKAAESNGRDAEAALYRDAARSLE